ncbi:MAG: glycosyltransferase family 39 protein [Candidatus Micrarchaeaceae archaeon]
MFSSAIEEYILTSGILISFIGFLVFAARGRKDISHAIASAGINRKMLIAALVVVLLFASLELLLVKPTQQLFFDDVIYQGGALDMLHMGQAWMCNYGTPTQCFTGLIFHEPVGTSFNIAIAFFIAGVHQYSAYALFFFLGALSVFLVFLITMLMFKRFEYAIFAEALMALSPALLVWTFPTTSDLTMLAYSLIAVFSVMIFTYRKGINTLGMVTFSIALAMYMKVDAAIYVVLIPLIYLMLDDESIAKSLRNNFRRIRDNALNTKVLLMVLLFVIAASSELMYTVNEYNVGIYRYNNTMIQDTCSFTNGNVTYINVTHNFDLQNFGANACVNTLFWFGTLQGGSNSYHIMQPIFFTFLAAMGAMVMLAYYRRQALALIVWFFAFFVLYASFYAGSVTYGVDWRFMLSMIAQVGILGGFGAGAIIIAAKRLAGMRSYVIAIAIISLLIAYSFYMVAPDIAISPSSISQAQQARFYQNFVYSNASAIPRSCLVFSFDPELFNLNGLSAMQFGNITSAYTESGLSSYLNKYPCLVVDYGYWCYTSGFEGLCNEVKSTFVLSPIATARDNFSGENTLYGFYSINGLR